MTSSDRTLVVLSWAVALGALGAVRCSNSSNQTQASKDAQPPAASASAAKPVADESPAPPVEHGPPATALDRVVDAFYAVQERRQVVISPDGQLVAWVDWVADKNQRSRGSAIYLADRKALTATPKRITAAGEGGRALEGELAFSPDSQILAFLSDAAHPKQPQLYTFARATGTVTRITDVHGYLTMPHFAPDGRTVATLFTEAASHPTGALEAIPAATGVVDEKIDEQRIAITDVASHVTRAGSPPDMFVYDYDFSPDGKQITAVAARGHGDSQYWVAKLHVLDVASGDFKAIYTPPRQIAVPRFSPDGAQIALVGGLMSDEGANGGDIFLVSPRTGAARNLTPGRKSSVSWLSWLPGNRELIFSEMVDGRTAISKIDVTSGEAQTLSSADAMVSSGSYRMSLSIADDGHTVAVARESFERPGEVYAGPLESLVQVTHDNDAVKPWWGRAESLHWESDRRRIQGWLVYPLPFDPSRKYPMVVSVHGGPAGSVVPSFKESALFAHEGYFVFFPNPRGSMGQGEAFTAANIKDFGGGDLRDILTGVDQVLKVAPVDKDRLAITGWSYGGYMSMWAVTQTHRFRAAAAGAGISNWQSYYGQNEIREWMIPYFGASVYDDPAVYAKSSPINFIKNVKTPTLVLVGDSDGECPTPQSFEFYRALKTLGVETQLMVYPREGHRIVEPEHRRDRIRRTVEWFDAKLNPPSLVPSPSR